MAVTHQILKKKEKKSVTLRNHTQSIQEVVPPSICLEFNVLYVQKRFQVSGEKTKTSIDIFFVLLTKKVLYYVNNLDFKISIFDDSDLYPKFRPYIVLYLIQTSAKCTYWLGSCQLSLFLLSCVRQESLEQISLSPVRHKLLYSTKCQFCLATRV